MTIRESILAIAVPWLQRRVASRVLWSVGLLLDADFDATVEGVKARMPGVGTPEALPLIGNDRLIERGPTESDESYAARLSGAFDTWQKMGNPRPTLEALRAYFLPAPPPVRVVSDRGVWHSIDPSSGEITRTKTSPSNWQWDGFAGVRWWRGWVVVDSSSGPWAQWLIGGGRTIGAAGLTIGSTATVGEVEAVRRLVQRTKPANVHAVKLIVAFDPLVYQPGNAAGAPMPAGAHDDPGARSLSAVYWEGTI